MKPFYRLPSTMWNPEAEKPGLGEIRAFASPFRMKNGPLGDDSLV